MSVQQTFCYLLNLKSMFTVSIESFRGYMGQTMYPMDYIGYNKVITHWYVCLTTGCFHVLYTDIQRSRLRHALSRRVQNAHVSGKGLGTGASLPSPPPRYFQRAVCRKKRPRRRKAATFFCYSFSLSENVGKFYDHNVLHKGNKCHWKSRFRYIYEKPNLSRI